YQERYKEAEEYLQRALKLSYSIGDLSGVKEWNKNLSDLYAKQNKWQLAVEHYKKYIATRDNLFNEASTKKTVQVQMNYEFDKKEAAAKLEQEKKEAVAIAESKKQKIIIWSVCGILILVIGFAIFAYRSFLQKQKANIEITIQKEIIEEKQKEILDSIHYASRIQKALITNESYFEKKLEQLITHEGKR